MRAVTFAEYGGPEVLTVSEVPVPSPGPGQVRVAVRAAGVNPVDWKIRNGALRAFFPVVLPSVPGVELAGVVDAVGEGSDLAVGEEVFGWAVTGAYAEHALAAVLARKPSALSWADAASLPVVGAAAVRDLGLLGVRAGETLLVHGASGATGRFAAQVALAKGATVVGTAGERHHGDLRALGVLPVHYGEGWPERVRAVAPVVDAVYDTAGHGLLPESVALAGGTARVLTIADPDAAAAGVVRSTGGEQSRGFLEEVARWVTDHGVRIAHRASYPLAEAAAAQAESEGGHPGGKITIDFFASGR